MSRDKTIDRLRGQLQNCVNHLDGIKRRCPSSTERIQSCIESANKALYETLHQDTHIIMPVKLTDEIIVAALPHLMRESDEDKYRALGQLICVWEALVEAAKESQCQS